ncbi:uncharacterized protein VP01_333g12 [Puccinia sorghi]|uniref:Rho-GAP domain-containing protein n=1 Tax=Puccinia sorghi TaxID=27349 RepID=A0A0L6UX33_9BASI|nr:uncharacterized protein VP01_333g12 [Puccinia sorghi]
MFSHLASRAKSVRPSRANSNNVSANILTQLPTHHSPFSSAEEEFLRNSPLEDSHLNSQLETLLHNHNAEEKEASSHHAGRLRANSAQTMNSIRTSSTHTTNTNSATSPGFFQYGQIQHGIQADTRPHSVSSQNSSTNLTFKSATRTSVSSSVQFSTSKVHRSDSKDSSIKSPIRGPFRTLSNASASKRRDRLLKQPPINLELQQQQHQQQQQQQQPRQHSRAQSDQISSGNHQQLEVITSSSTADSNSHSLSLKSSLLLRHTCENGSKPVDAPRSRNRLSLIPRPASIGFKPPNQCPEANLQDYNTNSITPSTSNSRANVDSRNTLLSANAKRRSSQPLLQNRWSNIDLKAGGRQQGSRTILNTTPPHFARSANFITHTPPTSLQAAPPKPRSSARQQQTTSSAPKPSRQLSTPNKPQAVQVRRDSSSTPIKKSAIEASVGFKFNPTVLDEGTPKLQHAQIPIRKESPEELIQHLERLIGHDELRLLTRVDKLLPQYMRNSPDGNNTHKEAAQDITHGNRRSTGNGILGRLGWKAKKGSSPLEPTFQSKFMHGHEHSREDRRATFGLLPGHTMRLIEPGVFGRPLEESDPFSCVTVIGDHKHLIPIVIFALVEEIYARGMETPGFMRIAGKVERVDALAESFDLAPLHPGAIDLGSEDIHVLCSLFKRYLRALPEPLMSRELFHILWSFCVRERKSAKAGHAKNAIAAAQCLLRLMPARPFSLLIYVVAFLSQIPLFPQCQFSSTGIAKIFGPALFGSRTQRNPTSDERAIQALQWVLDNWNALTDGLLSEHFTVCFSESPKPTPSSPPLTSVSAPASPEPSPSPSMENSSLKVLTTDTYLVTPDESHTSGRGLLECRPSSFSRPSNSSAQHIVDRYEAHEKNLAVKGELVGHLRRGSSGSPDEAELGPRTAPQSPLIGALSNITEGSNETQMMPNIPDSAVPSPPKPDNTVLKNDAVIPPDPIKSANEPTSNEYYGLVEREGKRISKFHQQSVLVLNEPAMPTTTTRLPDQIVDLIKSPELGTTNRTGKSFSAITSQRMMQRLDSYEVTSLIAQGQQLQELQEQLQGAMKPERTCDCLTNTVPENHVEIMLKQSIDLIQGHQDLLAQMKSQLSHLLSQLRQNPNHR